MTAISEWKIPHYPWATTAIKTAEGVTSCEAGFTGIDIEAIVDFNHESVAWEVKTYHPQNGAVIAHQGTISTDVPYAPFFALALAEKAFFVAIADELTGAAKWLSEDVIPTIGRVS